MSILIGVCVERLAHLPGSAIASDPHCLLLPQGRPALGAPGLAYVPRRTGGAPGDEQCHYSNEQINDPWKLDMARTMVRFCK